MAAPLKNIYNDDFFRDFSSAVKKIVPGLNTNMFLATIKNNFWEQMELKQRMRHIATVLHDELSGNYKNKLLLLLKIMRVLPEKSAGSYSSLAYMLIPDFVEQYGLNYPDISLNAMEQITPFTSCEFAIRPYLLKYPEIVMQQMFLWSQHKEESLRRFASEGCRPRLPWAMAIPFLKKDPLPILPILKTLKNDHSAFVRKSVANNLNDISKDHPELVIKLAKNWKGESAATDWIIKHGCRGLLKQGNAEILELFETGVHTKCSVQKLNAHKNKLAIGETLVFSFVLRLDEKKPAKLRVEYAIYFMKANGKNPRKKFKIAEKNYQPGESIPFSRQHSFKDLSTRKHYTGTHVLSIFVNGREYDSLHIELG